MKLTKRQFDLIMEGLDSLEKCEKSMALNAAMIGKIIMGIDCNEDCDNKFKNDLADATYKAEGYKKEVIMIKAKLYEAESELVDFGSEILSEK